MSASRFSFLFSRFSAMDLQTNHGPEAAAPVSLEQAYEYCARVARSHYENFTVASWLMPRQMRRHMYAIYAYARIADDFADEEHDLAKLDRWEHELDLAYAGAPRHPVFVAIADTVRRFDIPRQPFADLLQAFRSDVDFKDFETMDELLGYARYSANPVGRLVLYLFGFGDAGRQQLSDRICSGLQLANFWQDIAVDLAKGRVYLPRQDIARFGYSIGRAARRGGQRAVHRADASRGRFRAWICSAREPRCTSWPVCGWGAIS